MGDSIKCKSLEVFKYERKTLNKDENMRERSEKDNDFRLLQTRSVNG